MSREIKFRAWDKQAKRMMFRDVFDRNWYATPANDEGGCHCLRSISPDDKPRIELMQLTGLKDKNGKEIWEGDIVRWDMDELVDAGSKIITSGGVGQITWQTSMACFGFTKPNKYGFFVMEDMVIEVIGNIYENPELLK